MTRLLPYCLFLLFLACETAPETAPPPTDGNTVDEDFAAFLEEYDEMRLELNPLEATFLGDNRFNDRFPNMLSQEYKQRIRALYEGVRETLAETDRSRLSPTEQVSYDVLEYEAEINLEGLEFASELLPLDQFNGPHLMAGQLASGQSAQPFETAEDYDNWLARVSAFREMMDTARVNMERGLERGYVLPRALTEKLLPQLEGLAAEPLENHLFYSPVKMLADKDLTDEDRSRLETAYRDMVAQEVIPTFSALAQYVRETYLPASRESSGIDAIPGGEDYYNHLIRVYTTTDMTADEIHQLGLREVARLRSEMEKVKAEVGFDGDLKAFFDHVRDRPELKPFDDPREVIENFEAIHEKMKPQLAELFNKVPKTAFEVRRTEAFREATASAEYNPGSQDGSRPGIFYVPIPDVENYNVFSDEDLFLHEAIPGHHYQISLTQENEALPDFRRSLWYSAYGEGWALYCESLGRELGLYDDPYQYFGMLSAEMHRAIRLVVDTGMHAKGWSRERAIQYSLDNEAEGEASIIAEIERYMAIPAQALSYKVGQLKIRELRERALETMDIKTFHDLVLEGGCLPLSVLEEKVMAAAASK